MSATDHNAFGYWPDEPGISAVLDGWRTPQMQPVPPLPPPSQRLMGRPLTERIAALTEAWKAARHNERLAFDALAAAVAEEEEARNGQR